MNHVLWADDDSEGVLVAIRWSLEAERLKVTTAKDYVTACSRLETSLTNESDGFSCSIIDVILVQSESGATIDGHLGLQLAADVAQAGIPRIAFLTVVPTVDFKDEMERLRKAYGGTLFQRFEKLSILDPGQMEALIEFLKTGLTEQGKARGDA